MSLDKDLFYMARRCTLPAPAASSPTIPVPRPTLAEQLAAVEAAEEARRASVKAEAVALRATLDLSTLGAAPRGEVLYHLAHAHKHGHGYALLAAIKTYREAVGL